MYVIEQIKYVYLIILFIILIRTLIYTCLKITEYLLIINEEKRSLTHEVTEPRYSMKTVFSRVIILGTIGVLSSIAIFSIIGGF